MALLLLVRLTFNEDSPLNAPGSIVDEYQYIILGRVVYLQYTIEM